MFYYKVLRTSRNIRFIDYIYSPDRCFIIPIVSPNTRLGEALSNDDYLLLISDALEKVGADLIYVNKEDSLAYRTYIGDICSWAQRVAEIQSIKDPMIVIKTAREWELLIISDLDEDNPNDVKKLLWGIISCIGQEDTEKRLRRLIRRRKCSLFFSRNAETISSFLQIIDIAITSIVGTPGRPNPTG